MGEIEKAYRKYVERSRRVRRFGAPMEDSFRAGYLAALARAEEVCRGMAAADRALYCADALRDLGKEQP